MRVGSATVLKQGFHGAGFPLTHLSRFDHGSRTTTRLGIEVVAPFYRRAEDAYVAERVQIPADGSLGYLRTLEQRLQANRCVSIFGEHAGRQSMQVPILGIPRPFALGSPSIAWRSGSGLLTAYVLREGVFRYRLVVEREIAVETDVPRRRFAERAVLEYARRLEHCVRGHPPDWQTWYFVRSAPRPG
jgi:predicted LPLAT superfamily acyltransferase